ncbi:hypothetical protein AUEXF2481DRAFT_35709 [Aureobasidium subglaciale EXF-2481]|uniref:Uncharacterized protein n=1 Tax=Aureobasidium subglaciale (strain EXF-2481) TaxID=1043005 RepID=A0A074ZN27_AURSE|nr:uncharacterized protein AUEXF2481DRAFT_35709 [Aureobasidium subglaciale EXF-2481]KEQ99776.1 hypothetical protein AUEXF2481DRAFT_35709 [Aureobasidium subglaciale EXF-2481]
MPSPTNPRLFLPSSSFVTSSGTIPISLPDKKKSSGNLSFGLGQVFLWMSRVRIGRGRRGEEFEAVWRDPRDALLAFDITRRQESCSDCFT